MVGVEENLEARCAAEVIASLADGEAKTHGRRFWEELAKIVNAHAPFPAVRRKGETSLQMSDKEARRFGQQERIPFGEFAGMRVDEVPLDRLRWYADQTFVDELRRYLESNRVKNEAHD